ncbi:hypothetical protein E4T43_04676 [Aureobasidium subglaciale]|nr:hypothetical protein E4T43_04676 [Aureobasidium subglaciale]
MQQHSDWQRNCWSRQTVHHFKYKSPDCIQLRSAEGELQSINKALLCYYSTYYAAALDGQFAEAHRKVFDVDLSDKQLKVFVDWIYTGRLELLAWEREDRLMLYIFADFSDNLAFRRRIMTEDGRMERYREVGLALSSLPDGSSYCQRIVDHYANHWRPEDDEHDAVKNIPESVVHGSFFYEVLVRQLSVKGVKLEKCICCSNVCNYHEHESAEEWQATCGQDKNLEMPEALLKEKNAKVTRQKD